ncbi:MAG: hypothetical protein JW902_08385 [Syntrophaceae bacterium]|nr:hypothetical protein [Syntrophaceae bacterium]
MSSNMRSRLVWLIPFLVSGGMAFGALVGISFFSDDTRQEGPAGDIAGALGALMVIICIVAGFAMAALTIIVAKVRHRRTPDHIFITLVMSALGGIIIGVLVWNIQGLNVAVDWLLLLVGPVLLAWFCGTGKQVPEGCTDQSSRDNKES